MNIAKIANTLFWAWKNKLITDDEFGEMLKTILQYKSPLEYTCKKKVG
jgi:uncharacterized protein involved in tolerance to divalent cations